MTATEASYDDAGLRLAAADASLLADSIRSAGLKVTAPRLAVLRALTDLPHSNADALFGAVRSDLPGTSLQAVYGVLASFGTAGLVRKIEPAGSPALFERRVGDNHHHIVCTRCSVVHDVDCAVGHAPCLTPVDALGFDVRAAEVIYWGLCAQCQLDIGSQAETAAP
ncbi:Fur family transcriptional regulator [Cryobacterium sp. PH29-G1]|uniref:Fur family transcriptional regulator n=1 Tax=Cryobacterium sp. PH29-G1 TaxID=3046211 RepID=UPI0024B969E9|nr:Fur family transcriptional regulator [Cryobacterium sp. PH29-G1]MDJ0349827.1 Fur family transcriptional regulator [Cryobacterium sp. PH29-G1]